MKREIKFMAWDIVGKKFIMGATSITWENSIVSIPSSMEDQFILCQFTGLQDKNGKDIFEGDIVRGHYLGDQYQDGLVFWNRDGFYVKGAGTPLSNFALQSCLEIIGNKYENPELITDFRIMTK